MEENMKKHQMSKDYAENALIEKPAIELFEELGWRTKNCYNEFMHAAGSPLDRDTKAEVIVRSRLRPMLEQLNRNLPPEAFEQAIQELTRDRSAMSPVHANREIYHYLKNGIKVKIPDAEGEGEIEETVHIIDWETPENNDFFLASQFWITGDVYTRRADLVGFVNGLPLVFIELKASHKTLETAYTKNLSDYKDTIPHVFWYNAFIILSNGSQSKVGTITAGWEHFADWKKINDEGEEGIISLDTMIRGLCDKKRLLDLVENFILFKEVKGGLAKMFTKNHQYLGVNNVIKALKDIKSRKGRLGVFWHTQGSGKSISMIFFSQKVLRKIHGNWTFVIVTDRKDLDEQIYKKFARTGVITKKKIQAENSTHLRQLLREDHRYVFTLIQKFRTEKLEKHPVLSKRSDIIVITDEAHRTQYDTFALNMRTALPNASFIAFTGTPLIEGEEKTKEVFGDYVSIYNFKESVDDEATVPLYYENRIPELELTNEQLNEEIYQIVEEAQLDEEQELKVEREFSRQYQVITRDDRLEAVAKDIVTHFMGRDFRGKAMVVCIDKATTLRMYNKIQKYWKEYGLY
jgi:type I restriction enzyme R subunit